MIFRNLQKILWFTIVTLWTNVYAITGITSMKALILYAKDRLTTVTEALDSYGIIYEEWDASLIEKEDELTRYLYDKRPLFYMVIVDGNLEIYNEENGSWESALTVDQWKELDMYEAQNHIRRVVVNNYPKPQSGNEKYGGYEKGQIKTQKIVCADNNMNQKLFNDARIKRSAPLTSKGLIHSNIEESNDNGVIPILYFKPNSVVTKRTLAAALFDIGDGREVLSFFLQFSPESITVTVLNHLWITWASRGLISGYRRILFNPQIENVFLSTKVVDISLPTEIRLADTLTEEYRANAEDYRHIIEFMGNLSKSKYLSHGSSLKIELAFNGKGIYEADTAKSSLDRRYRINIDKNLERENFISETNKYWDTRNNYFTNDEVFNFFCNINNRREFNWVSNTYSNKILLDADEREIIDEIFKNIELAMHLGLVSRRLENSEIWWSKGSIGTRGSLGFTDMRIANILKKYNLHYGLGNQLREDLVHPKNKYLPWSSVAGDFQVIPRNKRLFLRWASDEDQAVWLFRKFNDKKEGTEEAEAEAEKEAEKEEMNSNRKKRHYTSKWQDILDLESDEAVNSLLKLKHNPFVFNQSNIAKSKYRDSIMAQWIKYTVKKLNKYVYWPVISAKSDTLANYYYLRALKKDCDPEINYSHNATHILSIELNSPKFCKVPITVAESVVQDETNKDFVFERIGDDPLTVWVTLPGDYESKIINLNPPLAYSSTEIIHFDHEESFKPDSDIEGDEDEKDDTVAADDEEDDNNDDDMLFAISSKNIKLRHGKSIKVLDDDDDEVDNRKENEYNYEANRK